MNEEIAVDPAIARDTAALQIVRAKVGFYNGRFISTFPKSWCEAAYRIIDAQIVNQTKKHQAKELLNKLKEDKALLSSGREYDPELSWHSNVLRLAHEKPFDLAITMDPAPGFVPIMEADEADWKGGRDTLLPIASVNALISATAPLLKSSRQLHLIDPYFDPRKKQMKNLFAAILRTAFGAKCEKITIVRSIDNWVPNPPILDQLQALIGTLGLQKNVAIRFCAVDDVPPNKLHYRYLFSECGGLSLDRGLQTNSSQFKIGYIDRGLHAELMKQYVDRPWPFTAAVDVEASG